MCLKEVSHVFYFILLGAISLAFKDIVSERRKEIWTIKKKSQQLKLPFSINETNKPKKKKKSFFFFINTFFFQAGILGQYIKFPQKEALELFT